MARVSLYCLGVALLLVGCEREDGDSSTAMVECPQRARPVVAVVPVIDSTDARLGWSLSNELSREIYQQLTNRDSMTLVNPRKIRTITAQLGDAQNPFGADFQWVKQAFKGEDFVVFLELAEHEEVYRKRERQDCLAKDCSADLKMSMRVRIFDVRGETPKVVLQEMVEQEQYVPKLLTSQHCVQVRYDHDAFDFTPMGMAHEKFVKQIGSRIDDYVKIALGQ